MHVDQIKYLLTVAKYLSFSKASDALFISQSAISQSISKLEKELGFTLFVRSTKKVVITEKGLYAIEIMKKIVALNDELLSIHTSDEATHTVRLSVVKGLYLPFISDLLNDTKFGSTMKFTEKDTASIIDDIKMGITDIGVIPIYEENNDMVNTLQVLPLIDIKLYVFVSADSHLASKQHITSQDLANENIAMYDGPYLKWLVRLIKQHTTDIDILFYSTNQEFIRNFVLNKRAISIDTIAENAINPYITSKEIISIPLLLDFSHSSFLGLVTRNEDQNNPFFKEILKLIESLVTLDQDKQELVDSLR
ncbi:hypothetical protein CSV74_05445 [Sporosarcina sp. P19]|uniref:LysR family transcriptional regulator n=1 Tax=Sporosarcina sp. P19 TaxID=2048258 RepID=UPI000C170F69|nr:LysR family transcriptional regulator [Sporosarcina sp. P19]PIC77534.1 hypothetical protein CSV74_05445 [Sporosarcina sp. P19]